MAKTSRTGIEDSGEHYRKMLDWGFDVSSLRECVTSIRSTVLLPAASAFATNFENIDSLQMMPFMIAADGIKRFYFTLKYVRTGIDQVVSALKGGQVPSALSVDLADTKARIREADKLFRSFLQQEGGLEEFASQIDSSLSDLVQQEVFQTSIRVLLTSSTTLIWTAFECLARDLWVSSLNTGNTILAQTAFRSVGAKNIQVGLIARYGFDLRNHLGSLLSSKVKFSDVSGIHKAYVAAYENPDTFGAIFDRDELRFLEKCRHLIAHRAGIIDEKFKKETSSVQEVGEVLVLDANKVSGFAASAIDTGVKLLRFVDSWLVDHPATNPQPERE